MRNTSVAFRVDASNEIGTGHVMRCMTLGAELVRQGRKCMFISRAHSGNLIELIQGRGFETVALDSPQENANCNDAENSAALEHSTWLGADWLTDAKQTKEALGQAIVDWLIVDHYALDMRWEQELSTKAKNILAIDDIADRPHRCDVLIDQNYESKERYAKLVTSSCKLLLGPKYALLAPEYGKAHAGISRMGEQARRVLVYFGGSDPCNLTSMAVEALSDKALENLNIDAVIGANYFYHDLLEKISSKRGNVKVHSGCPSLLNLMAEADLSVGACGVTTWERICLGLPSVVVTVANNQVPLAEILHGMGAINFVGDKESVSADSLADAIGKEIHTMAIRDNLTKNRDLCDGLGVERIVSHMK